MLLGVVVLEVVVLALPGVPTIEAGGYVFCAVLLVLAALVSARRWALVSLALFEGLLAVSGVVAAVGPTRNVELGLFAALAVASTVLAVLQLRTERRPVPAG